VLISVSSALSQTPAYTARPQLWSRDSTRYIYQWRDGQDDLTWVAGYMPRWFTHLLTFILTKPGVN